MPLRPFPSLLAVALLPACSSSPTNAHLEITAGQEQDTFSMAPSVVRIDITATSLDGSVKLTTSTTPGGAFDFGDIEDDQRLSFEVTGFDSTNAAVVRGRSLSGVPLGGDGSTLPIFVARKVRWSRPPGGLLHTHVAGPAGVLGEQHVFVAGGAAMGPASPAQGDFYDLLNLKGKAGSTGSTLPRVPETIVSGTASTILINAAGATVINEAGTIDLAPPAGASFADVTGGRQVDADDGRAFVVGATRPSMPTASVMIIATDGKLSVASLQKPRAGAAAIFVKGTGLVVAGGSADGPGVEVLADGATAFVTRDFPADPIEGAGAVLAPGGGIALVGGVASGIAAPTRRLDPACLSACSAQPVQGADLPAAMGGVSAFTLPGDRVIAVGNEIGGKAMTRSFLIHFGGAVTELPLREPRMGASVIPAPNGTLAILGGLHEDSSAALSVEMLFPE